MVKRKRQSNSTSNNSQIDKMKTRSLTVNDNELKKLLNHIDSCKKNEGKNEIIRAFKYNATSTISRTTVKTFLKVYKKGLFKDHKYIF